MKLQIKTLFTLCSIFICTMGIAQEDKNYRETPLPEMEIKKHFPAEVLQQIGVEFPIFRVYPFEDKDGKQYLILTEKVTKGNIQDENSLKRSIKAFNVSFEEDETVKVRWTITDYIDETEKSIGFWTQYLNLKDLDNDGFVDPIVVYGTKSNYGKGFEEGRVKIIIYHLGKKIAIRQQNSSLDDGRLTQVDQSFDALPLGIKKKVYDMIGILEDRGYSLFTTEVKNQIKKSLKGEGKVVFSSDKGETIDEFLQRAKKAALSDVELQKMINFPLRVRGLDENLNVFEDKFYSFAEIKDNIMLYDAIFKDGLLSAVSISRGDCHKFKDKNCFVIKSTEIVAPIEVVLLKKGKRYIIVGIIILTA